MIVLVHHARAVEPASDPQRPLTAQGRAHAERLAAECASRGVKPAAIWHSGKLRARQTAEALWRACNPLAEFAAVRGLQPADPPQWIHDRLLGDARELMLVGHMPNLALIASSLGGSREGFPLHGAVAFEWNGEVGRQIWALDM